VVIRNLRECEEFVAGDGTLLRELLHPDKHGEGYRYSLAEARLAPGMVSAPHRLSASEVYYITAGRGRMHIDGEEREVAAGDAILIPPEARQYIESLGPDELVFLCIVDPAWTPEAETVETGPAG
jgi:mannose-6-phosphate isomerase-like protein (cupin superfamily)